MDIASQLSQAFSVMLTGMVVVFCFLTLLIATVTLMSRISQKFSSPEPEKKTKNSGSIATGYISSWGF